LAVTLVVAQVWACEGDRKTLFDIRAELQKGMSRADVDAVIQRHATPKLSQQAERVGSDEWLRIISDDSCILTIGFQENKLNVAELRDEDMATAPCRGAPPDLK
jgi:hypothetical protein